jgi:hypothetical protein
MGAFLLVRIAKAECAFARPAAAEIVALLGSAGPVSVQTMHARCASRLFVVQRTQK